MELNLSCFLLPKNLVALGMVSVSSGLIASDVEAVETNLGQTIPLNDSFATKYDVNLPETDAQKALRALKPPLSRNETFAHPEFSAKRVESTAPPAAIPPLPATTPDSNPVELSGNSSPGLVTNSPTPFPNYVNPYLPGAVTGYPTPYPIGFPVGAFPGYPSYNPNFAPGYPPAVPIYSTSGSLTSVPVAAGNSVPNYPAGRTPGYPGYPLGYPSYPLGYPTSPFLPPPGGTMGYPAPFAGYPTPPPNYPIGYPGNYPPNYPIGYPQFNPLSYPPNYPVGYPGNNPGNYPPYPPNYPVGYPTNYPASYPGNGLPASGNASNQVPGYSPTYPVTAPVNAPIPQAQSIAPIPPGNHKPLVRSSSLSSPSLQVQGVYLYQGSESSARGRLSGVYPVTPNLMFGGTFDLTTGKAFTDSPEQGFSVNELYLAASFQGAPGLRFAIGQLDLSSYFDRNSFAKDGATQFFNSIFQTNPALSATGIGSRPGFLVNWRLNDNIETKAAVFSSAASIGDFALDGFAGEVGLRFGNAIIRGTYATGRDAGNRDGFEGIFQLERGNGRTGPLRGDREEAFGVNAEVFIPDLKMGLFARYGRQNNLALGKGGDTYSFGVTFLDLLMKGDRLGLAYGRGLSNENLRTNSGLSNPDALELFYDFRVLPYLRLGVSLQQRDNFSETVAGFRIRTEFDIFPSRTPAP